MFVMDMIDIRKLTPEARQERRRQVIRLRLRSRTCEAIAPELNLSRTGVFDICERYEQGGAKALADKSCGRLVGVLRTLSESRERGIRRLIIDHTIDHTPDRLKMNFALWTRQAVRLLIQERCEVRLTPHQGVALYLHRWGFTPQKPIERGHEQPPAAVRRWLNVHDPHIEQRAKAEGAEIHRADETGLRFDDVRGCSYAPIGQPPESQVNQHREGRYAISSVTNRGKGRFKAFEGAMRAAILTDCMGRLVQEVKKGKAHKVFLGQANPGSRPGQALKVHHTRRVKAWLEKNKPHIEVFYQPSYSPERKPDEMLQANLKAAVTATAPNRGKGQLKQAAIGHLRHWQKSPAKVRQFFQQETVKYVT